MTEQARYRVAVTNLPHKEGKTVTAADFPEGTNIAALVEGGSLQPITDAGKKEDKPDG